MLDTNVYIDWSRAGRHEAWVVGGGMVRHLSAVVLMELEMSAISAAAQRGTTALARTYQRLGRLHHPSRDTWLRAGAVLRQLRAAGLETRRASLVHDVLIALSAREVGATLVTRDASDHAAIAKHVDYAAVYVG